MLAGVDGILVPGGFGERGIEGKVDAIRFARQRGIPFFGICLGMAVRRRGVRPQCPRSGAGQFDRIRQGLPSHPVICLLDEQKTITDKGGTMRLGAHTTLLESGTKAALVMEPVKFPSGIATDSSSTTPIAGSSPPPGCGSQAPAPTASLVEVVEIADHPWFVGVQFHPEFKSQPTRAHPLFGGFVGAALQHHRLRPE